MMGVKKSQVLKNIILCRMLMLTLRCSFSGMYMSDNEKSLERSCIKKIFH